MALECFNHSKMVSSCNRERGFVFTYITIYQFKKEYVNTYKYLYFDSQLCFPNFYKIWINIFHIYQKL